MQAPVPLKRAPREGAHPLRQRAASLHPRAAHIPDIPLPQLLARRDVEREHDGVQPPRAQLLPGRVWRQSGGWGRRRHGRGRIRGGQGVEARGGEGVGEGVEFAAGGDVAGDGERAAHDADAAGAQEGGGRAGGGEREVGERTERDEGECVGRVGVEEGEDLVDGVEVRWREGVGGIGRGFVGCGGGGFSDGVVVGGRSWRWGVEEVGPGVRGGEMGMLVV